MTLTECRLSLTDFVHIRVYEATHPHVVEKDELKRRIEQLTASVSAASDEVG